MRADAEHSGRLEWLLARARLLEAAGDDRAADAWAALLEQHPDNVRAAKAVIESNVAWNDRDLVDRAIQQVRQASGDDGIAWRLARARWILNGEPDDADRVIAQTVKLSADELRELATRFSHIHRARLYLSAARHAMTADGDTALGHDKLAELIDDAATAAPDAPDVQKQAGDLRAALAAKRSK